jgi:hypothetical protein
VAVDALELPFDPFAVTVDRVVYRGPSELLHLLFAEEERRGEGAWLGDELKIRPPVRVLTWGGGGGGGEGREGGGEGGKGGEWGDREGDSVRW